ncbi:Fc.00g027340.m01.CDS01 [Cosmosporella sp. VM-42]
MIEFTPNCTFPTTFPSGFIKAPNIRSTTEIVWSCTSIITLSTWSVLHLTVPPDLKPQSKLQKFRKQAYLLGRKLAWTGIMLAFPEYLVGISTTNLFACWINDPRLEELARDDDVPWSLTHTILANMGGIALRFSEPDRRTRPGQSCRPEDDPDEAILASEPNTNTGEYELASLSSSQEIRVAFSGQSSQTQLLQPDYSVASPPDFLHDFRKSQENHLRGLGDAPWKPFGPHLALATRARTDTREVLGSAKHYKAKHIAPLHGNTWILDSKQLALARIHGVIPKLPCLEENEINDKSKSDGLVRLLALLQVLWLAIQLIIRRAEGYPFSALEVSTLAFSSCAFIIYVSEWPKPKDVGVPFYVDTDAVVSPEAFAIIAEAAPISFLQARHYYIPQSVVHQVFEGCYQKKHIDRIIILTSIISTMLFGGLHLFARNLELPSHIEKYLWRGSALTVAIAPTVSALLVPLESVLFHRIDRYTKWSVTVLGPLYLFGRLFIIVESYRSLCFLPPGAFISTWASNVPHVR